MLFDSHAHYDDEKFKDDRYKVIENVHRGGVSYILNASTNLASAIDCIAFAQEFEYVYAAVGIHPHNAEEVNNNSMVALADFAGDKKVVAIGEIGLDYFYNNSPKEIQKHWFARQINLAVELNLPIIVHDRDAHEDTMKIIENEKAESVGGVFHCYSGSVEMAKELLKKNFYISIGGSVTFKNAKRIIDVVKFVSLDRILIETDCPYMTPEPFRGKRNDSGYIRLVAEKIAEIRGKDFEEIASITTENAKRLFKIK
jgi:TatD DNase family protein